MGAVRRVGWRIATEVGVVEVSVVDGLRLERYDGSVWQL